MAASQGMLIHNIRDVTVVTFSDATILDAVQVDKIGNQLYALVDEQNRKKLILDFTDVRLLSSSALGVLITLRKKADAIKGKVVLCGVRPELKKPFTITRLDKMFKFADDEEKALAVFGVTSAG